MPKETGVRLPESATVTEVGAQPVSERGKIESFVNGRSLAISTEARARVETIRGELPPIGYGIIKFLPGENKVHVGMLNGNKPGKEEEKHRGEDISMDEISGIENVVKRLKEQADGAHIVAAGISGENGYGPALRRELWFKHDIVPIHFEGKDEDNMHPHELTAHISKMFTEEGIAKPEVDPVTHEYIPSQLVAWEDYERTSAPEDVKLFHHLVDELDGMPIHNYSSTPEGGGVVKMLGDEVRIARAYNEAQKKLGSSRRLNFRWFLMKGELDSKIAQELDVDPNTKQWETTKLMHNTHQARTTEPFTQHNANVYEAMTRTNAEHLKEPLNNEEAFHIFHDGQPKGLRKHSPVPADQTAGRIHIALKPDLIADPESQQHKVWNFLKDQITDEDGELNVGLVQFHPSREPYPEEFLPRGADGLDASKIVLRPAAVSRVGGGTKELPPEIMERSWNWMNNWLVEHGQAPLDPNRPIFVIESRFDESKNQDGVAKVHKLITEKMIKAGFPESMRPQTVIFGEGADDDPSGIKIEKQINEQIASPEFDGVRHDMRTARLPNVEQVRNALVRRDPVGEDGEERTVVAIQPSWEEGCEVNVSQHRWKGVPVIGSNRGGIPRQIIDGVTGYVVEPDDYEGMAERAFKLFTNSEKYEEMSKASKENFDSSYTTMADLVDWMGLIALKKNGRYDAVMAQQKARLGRQPFAREMIMAEYDHVVEQPEKQQRIPQQADVFVAVTA